MKNIEKIKNEIQFALDNKKIDGFIENDSLYVRTPIGVSSIVIIATLGFFISPPLIIKFMQSLEIKDGPIYLLPFMVMIASLASIFICKEYLVIDYTNNRIYKVPKFYKFYLIKSHFIDFRSIQEIGINMVYKPGNLQSFSFKDLFNKKIELEKFERITIPVLVYLSSDCKLKNLSGFIKNNDDLINLGNLCNLIGKILEIPSVVCERNQRIEIDKTTNPFSLKVKTLEYNQEKKNYIKGGFKKYFIALALNLIVGFIVVEATLIYYVGFYESIQVLYETFLYLFLVLIPRKLGLK